AVSLPRYSQPPVISADGRYVTFEGHADLVDAPRPPNYLSEDDVFVYDRLTGTNTLVSKTAKGYPTGGYAVGISADGHFVLYTYDALYLYNVATGTVTPVAPAGGLVSLPDVSETGG